MFSGASTFVEGVDTAFAITIGISLFFLIGISAVVILFLFRYDEKKHPKAVQIEGNTSLEIIWTVIPILLVLLMFYYGWAGWINMKRPPEGAMEVKVNARMWSFSFEYENGRVTDRLYVPIAEPVRLNLNAMDVLHSLYIPAFRLKEDMVPGLVNNRAWFEATKEGTYSLFCAEYCGLQHSFMYTDVVVMSQEDFLTWYSDTTGLVPQITDDTDLALLGRQITERYGCIACHSIDGSRLVGPSFQGIYGETHVVITDGQEREVVVDDAYIRTSVYEPDADIVKGYRRGQMISYENEVSEEELSLIIEFIKSLNE
jgi:cytochrome c oxidase subunit II